MPLHNLLLHRKLYPTIGRRAYGGIGMNMDVEKHPSSYWSRYPPSTSFRCFELF